MTHDQVRWSQSIDTSGSALMMCPSCAAAARAIASNASNRRCRPVRGGDGHFTGSHVAGSHVTRNGRRAFLLCQLIVLELCIDESFEDREELCSGQSIAAGRADIEDAIDVGHQRGAGIDGIAIVKGSVGVSQQHEALCHDTEVGEGQLLGVFDQRWNELTEPVSGPFVGVHPGQLGNLRRTDSPVEPGLADRGVAVDEP